MAERSRSLLNLFEITVKTKRELLHSAQQLSFCFFLIQCHHGTNGDIELTLTRLAIAIKAVNISDYSHSIVPGGLEVMSKTTRFTPSTSFTIRLEIVSSRS